MTAITGKQVAYILFVGSLALSVGLIPTLLDEAAYVPLETSLPVTATLGIYAVVFFLSKQKVPAAGMAAQALAWGLVALLRH